MYEFEGRILPRYIPTPPPFLEIKAMSPRALVMLSVLSSISKIKQELRLALGFLRLALNGVAREIFNKDTAL